MQVTGPDAGGCDQRLLGRQSELDAFDAVLAAAAGGRAGAVAIVGEAGIGKTRLLAELRRRAAATGFEVLEGSGTELGYTIPFGLVVDALDARIATLGAEAVKAIAGETLADLAVVLPSVFAVFESPSPVGLAAERYEYHRAVRSLLERFTHRVPLLLAFDDTHWSDPASIELIDHLLRRPIPRMVLALAFRSRPVQPTLLGAVEHAQRTGLLVEFELAPLTLPEAADLLGQRPDAPVVRELHAATGGNPFYLEQLARTVSRPDGRAVPGPLHVTADEADIPSGLRSAIAMELHRLSRAVLTVAQAAAVAGDSFDVDLVRDMAEADLSQVMECVDELVAADIVRHTGNAGRFRFRHPVVRRVVYDSAPSASRLGIHRRAARILEQRGASPSTRAHHVERFAYQGEEEAIATLVEAGHSTAERAPAKAAGWFEAALRLLPANSKSSRRRDLLIAQARALTSCGRLRDSRAALEQALQLTQIDAPEDRARIVAMIAQADHGLGRADQVHRLVVATLERSSPSSPSTIPLHLIHVENLLMRGRWDEAVQTARQAHTLAHQFGDGELELIADCWLAWAASHSCDVHTTCQLIDRSADTLDQYDVDLSQVLTDSLVRLVYAEFATDRFRAAGRHIERGLQVSRTTGQNHFFTRFLLIGAVTELVQGRLHDASTSVEAAVEAARVLDSDQALAAAEAIRCWVETLKGDLAAALVAGRVAVEAADRRPNALFAWLAHTSYGQALIDAGHLELGRRAILSAGGRELSDLPPSLRPVWHLPLLVAELAAGRIDDAAAIAQRIEASAPGLLSREGHVHHARSCISFATGSFSEAAVSAQKAADCFDAVGMPIWTGRALLVAGRARYAADEAASAAHTFEVAYGIFCQTGAARLRDEAAKELRALGRRVRPPTGAAGQSHPELTEREREIAESVAHGYSNRDIAAQLYISPKTVEKHLARVFVKLGVTSRAGVAAALTRTTDKL
ncbi:helix-turn-helix transcriptional regulator [Nocardia gamkensis]|uniref:helix-turn-helix transcriptional regulator n=1 Tax=Nocardia gamkensis TaxID=352869 RepID=UPI0037C61714